MWSVISKVPCSKWLFRCSKVMIKNYIFLSGTWICTVINLKVSHKLYFSCFQTPFCFIGISIYLWVTTILLIIATLYYVFKWLAFCNSIIVYILGFSGQLLFSYFLILQSIWTAPVWEIKLNLLDCVIILNLNINMGSTDIFWLNCAFQNHRKSAHLSLVSQLFSGILDFSSFRFCMCLVKSISRYLLLLLLL